MHILQERKLLITNSMKSTVKLIIIGWVVMSAFTSSLIGAKENKTTEQRYIDKIEYGNCKILKGKSKKFVFRQQDADTRQIRFIFEAHFDWSTLGGYAPGMQLYINNQKITGSRLLNKPLKFKTRVGQGHWGSPKGNSYYLMYSNDFSDKIKTNENYMYGLWEKDQEPYRFVFDLTGLTQHNSENTVTLNATRLPIIVQNARVEFDNKFMPRINDLKAMIKPAPTGILADCTLKKIPKANLSLKSSAGGAVVIASEKMQFPITSKFSLPDGKWLDFELSKDLKTENFPYVLTRKTPEYSITRRIERKNGYIKFYDTFKNLRNKVTGIMFENSLHLPCKPDKVLFGGTEVMLKKIKISTNPSFGAQVGNHFVALLAEDDIYRAQGYFKRCENELIMGDRNLGLPPNTSYTLEWSFYLIEDGGYYDFVNEVRRTWDSNFLLDGPFTFPYGAGSGKTAFNYWAKGNISAKDVNDFLTKRKARYIITHVPGNYSVSPSKDSRDNPRLGHGTALFDPKFKWWCNQTRNMTTALKKYAPQVQVHSYLHKNLCSELGNREKYKDSIALDFTYKKLTKTSTYAYYVPTLNNSYGKALKNVYQYMVDNLDTHIYMDEISVGVTAWEQYPEWDECTVLIDPITHKVKNKVSIPNLLIRPWLKEMADYLKSKNRQLIANCAPATRTVQDFRAIHFVEHAVGESGHKAAHFSTPLDTCYSNGVKGFKHLREALEYGFVSFIDAGDWSRNCFPMTPMELRSGYIICKERIITKRSGLFGWDDTSDADIFVYNGEGKRTSGEEVKKIIKNNNTIFEVRMPSDHIAIIVKK